jgi:hypothetical protein
MILLYLLQYLIYIVGIDLSSTFYNTYYFDLQFIIHVHDLFLN